MTPAFALVEAAIVADRLQITSARVDQLLQLPIRHERLDAVEARDLREHQRRERLQHTCGVRVTRRELRQESLQDGPHRRGGELLAAHPRCQCLECDPVAQRGIGAAEAGDQVQRQRLAAICVRDRELVSLQVQQLLARHRRGRASLPDGRGRKHDSSQRQARCGSAVHLVFSPVLRPF